MRTIQATDEETNDFNCMILIEPSPELTASGKSRKAPHQKGKDPMRFYNHSHPYYCGIDLHARSLYVCVIDDKGETLVHKEIKASPQPLLPLLENYRHNIVGVECMHC